MHTNALKRYNNTNAKNMSATAWVISILYLVGIGGALAGFGYWGITRHDEDKIWRVIISFLGLMLFGTIFWLSYWLGTYNAAWIGFLTTPAVYTWLYLVFSRRTPATLDRIVFAAFGTVVLLMVFYGGYSSGQNGWWGMAIPFYLVAFGAVYARLIPD